MLMCFSRFAVKMATYQEKKSFRKIHFFQGQNTSHGPECHGEFLISSLPRVALVRFSDKITLAAATATAAAMLLISWLC
jgi:hypothetical protein